MNDDEQQPIDATPEELQAWLLRRVATLKTNLDGAVLQRDSGKERNVLVAVEIPGLRALSDWVAEGGTVDEVLRRREVANQVCADALGAVDADDFNRRFRDGLAKAIQGSAN
jgi:hypothetical protein